MKFKQCMVAVVSTILAIGGVYAAAKALNFHLDRPAWHSEVLELAGYSLPNVLQSKERKVIQIRAHIEELRRGGRRAPSWLADQLRALQGDIKNIRKILYDR